MRPSIICRASFSRGPQADEVILLNDFAKELDAKNPKGLIGQEVTLRYGEQQRWLPMRIAADRPQLSGAQSGAADSDDAVALGSRWCARRRS